MIANFPHAEIALPPLLYTTTPFMKLPQDEHWQETRQLHLRQMTDGTNTSRSHFRDLPNKKNNALA